MGYGGYRELKECSWHKSLYGDEDRVCTEAMEGYGILEYVGMYIMAKKQGAYGTYCCGE